MSSEFFALLVALLGMACCNSAPVDEVQGVVSGSMGARQNARWRRKRNMDELSFMGSKSLSEGVCQRYLHLQHGGRQRNFIVHAPRPYCGTKSGLTSIPLVFALHGFGAPSGMFTPIFGHLIVPLSFVLVQPLGTGSPTSFNGVHCCGSAVEQNVDDVGFIAAIVRSLQEWIPVDTDGGVVGTGFSNGAFLLEHVIASGVELFSSIVPVGGHLYGADKNLSWVGPLPVFLQVRFSIVILSSTCIVLASETNATPTQLP
jgi:poly(3-hydroxybutyrate) depolymerase